MFDSALGDRRVFRGGRWLTAAIVLVMGLIVAVVVTAPLTGGEFVAVWIVAVAVILGSALWLSPLRPGRHQPIATLATEAPEVAVLWRPGCVFSAKLHRELEREHGSVAWVNIWRDPEAAAVCRRLNGGEEQVPTAVVIDRRKSRPTVIPATVAGISEAQAELRVVPRRTFGRGPLAA